MAKANEAAVHLELDGAVATLVVDAPPVNAIGDGVLERLCARLDEIDGDTAVRAVVLTGAGSTAFMSGADLHEFSAMLGHGDDIEHHMTLSRLVFDRLGGIGPPVIAAVQASAFGGGFEVALACDIVVADSDAHFRLPEVRLGLIPGAGGTQRVSRQTGRLKAAPLLFLGRSISAQNAFELGLVSILAPPGQALESAQDVARQIASNPAHAVRAIKRALRGGERLALPEALELERSEFVRILATRDARQGVDAFLAKRRPVYVHE